MCNIHEVLVQYTYLLSYLSSLSEMNLLLTNIAINKLAAILIRLLQGSQSCLHKNLKINFSQQKMNDRVPKCIWTFLVALERTWEIRVQETLLVQFMTSSQSPAEIIQENLIQTIRCFYRGQLNCTCNPAICLVLYI